MKHFVLAWMVSATVLLATPTAPGEQILNLSDFQDGTSQDWASGTPGPDPIVVPTGGPAGEADQFLQFSSTGGNGPGSRLAILNDDLDWTGDYTDRGVTAVEVDMMNPVTTPTAVQMRLVLFGPNSTFNRWTSTTALEVPNDGIWRRYSFPLGSLDLTRVGGNATYEAMFNDVERIMLRHDSSTPSSQGTVIVGTLGIDNVALLGPESIFGDFNGDTVLDIHDLDLLLSEVHAGTNDPTFDINEDLIVDSDDIRDYVESPELLNSYIGDANLDGEFNTGDLVSVLQAGQYEDSIDDNSTWSSGDWNGNADFDTGDLVFALQSGGFEMGPRATEMAAVPEPESVVLLLLSGISLLTWRRVERKTA